MRRKFMWKSIEMGRGATYSSDRWTVYSHDTYPRGSVLAGQERRTFVDDYDSLLEAKAAHPTAQVIGNGSTYRAPDVSHLSPYGDL